MFVRVTESEHEALLKSARVVGLSVPSFVREAALRRRMKPLSSVIDLRAVQEMNRLGNNLNQLLVLTHSHRAPAELTGTVERILALLSAIHGRVGDRGEGETE